MYGSKIHIISEYQLTNTFAFNAKMISFEGSTAVTIIIITEFLVVHIIAKSIAHPFTLSTICRKECLLFVLFPIITISDTHFHCTSDANLWHWLELNSLKVKTWISYFDSAYKTRYYRDRTGSIKKRSSLHSFIQSRKLYQSLSSFWINFVLQDVNNLYNRCGTVVTNIVG